MTSTADISGSFQRPSLVDYLIVAEHQSRDLGLRLWIGALEIGLIAVCAGEVAYAELPGAGGDTALTLLAKLPARVTPEPWVGRDRNVHKPWRELIDEQQWGNSPGRSQRLTAIRAELAELDEETGELDSQTGASVLADETEVPTRARRVSVELLDWLAIEAYLEGEREQARALLTVRERSAPGDLLCAANLERLRLRLLEDDIEASVKGAGQ
ncbi:MAG: hypothetical protein KC431_03025 [Myxococcales bacterium]|nr:hypothetical protein [Myxococcales bacterium]